MDNDIYHIEFLKRFVFLVPEKGKG